MLWKRNDLAEVELYGRAASARTYVAHNFTLAIIMPLKGYHF
jgi:hypothetical protein